MQTRLSRPSRALLAMMAAVQIILGLAFLAAPERSALLLGLPQAPGWSNWLFGMMAARFLGYGYGLIVALRQPAQAAPWLRSMLVIQALDWLVTLKYLWLGAVTLPQVNTAAFLPLLFIAACAVALRQRPPSRAAVA
ncbi:hypothetical protein [Chitinilyticum piscinae]|uniref:Uncharacterized protein n=1 Tax=Chitinilyticum piscinae TaxID=2866724 RepID=A0A8J7FKQ6_9NEIS|nr:hypothetical protein [Chitinilyticum piscinae]MBE9607921.1 hypothetical protein [Chitinilyticum piscinae]